MWKGYFCLFFSLNNAELQLYVYNVQAWFLPAPFPEQGTELIALLPATKSLFNHSADQT